MLNVTHSVMFHHFHDETHPKMQGSLSQSDFSKMIDWLQGKYNLLDADVYMEKALHGSLSSNDICLSFDDALLCQIDIALPELDRRNLKAFFFVYSGTLVEGEGVSGGELEMFRYFRCVNYTDIDRFYADFFKETRARLPEYEKERCLFERANHLAEFKFYSDNDRWFRWLRDMVFDKVGYEDLMKHLMEENNFSIGEAVDLLWMKDQHIIDLKFKGHLIGLHSETHPMQMQKLDKNSQFKEYSNNYKHLSRLIGDENVTSMSHPCGDYNADTLSILNELGVKIGFRSSMNPSHIESLLEIPREDHANVAREMGL